MTENNARFEKITGEAEFEVIGIEIQGNFDGTNTSFQDVDVILTKGQPI